MIFKPASYTFPRNLLYLKTNHFEFIVKYGDRTQDESVHMKTHGLFGLLIFLVPLAACAGWQMSEPQTTVPREPFFQAGTQRETALSKDTYPSLYTNLGKTAPVYAVSISGSLKDNLERIMKRYHWKVVWKAPYDYKFDGKVTGSSLPNVVQKLLKPFPLQAVMYMSNRTVAVLPREQT